MAVAAGVGAGDLLWVGGGAFLVWMATPAGQSSVKSTANALSQIGKKSDDAQDLAPSQTCAECAKKACPPCPAPPPPDVHRVPPSDPHYPCPGDHWHYFKYNQNPTTCKCYLQRLFGGCMPQGAPLPNPPPYPP
jgi:hypothetical protein